MAFEAHLAHNIPGRLRLKFPGLKRDPGKLERIAQSVESLPDVLGCDYNPITGTVLIHYRRAAHAGFVRDVIKLGAERALFDVQTQSLVMAEPNGSSAKLTAGRLQGIRKAAGNFLLFIGLAGVLLPIVPGTPFLLAALALVGENHVAVRRARKWFERLRRRPV